MKRSPEEVAREFLAKFYPDCSIAVLAGSVARNEAKAGSDLDIVLIDEQEKYMSRNCFEMDGWPIEAFVYNSISFNTFFESECMLGNPALPRMCAEGIILKGGQMAEKLQREAKVRIEQGPLPWTEDQINYARYMITDTLDDFIHAMDETEKLCIVNCLANLVQEFILRTNKRWTGQGKWMVRAFRQYNDKEAEVYFQAFEQFYKDRKSEPVIDYVDKILKPYGGRLFDGYKQ